METYNNIEDARKAHSQRGGFLFDLSDADGDCFDVTDDSPIEYRDFRTTREAVDYTLRLAQAGYDETRMGKGGPPDCCPVCGSLWNTSLLAHQSDDHWVKEYRQLLVTLAMQGEETSLELEAVDQVIRKAEGEE